MTIFLDGKFHQLAFSVDTFHTGGWSQGDRHSDAQCVTQRSVSGQCQQQWGGHRSLLQLTHRTCQQPVSHGSFNVLFLRNCCHTKLQFGLFCFPSCSVPNLTSELFTLQPSFAPIQTTHTVPNNNNAWGGRTAHTSIQTELLPPAADTKCLVLGKQWQ